MACSDLIDIDSEPRRLGFMNNTHGLHDSCITSVEFNDGRFVASNGAMHSGNGGLATLTLHFDSQFGTPPAKFKLIFFDVSRFIYAHDATDDGLIYSCTVTLTDDGIRFACNDYGDTPCPLIVAKRMQYGAAI